VGNGEKKIGEAVKEEILMTVNIEIKIVPFGQIRLEVGKPASPVGEKQVTPVREAFRYHEPEETVSRIYEVRYEKGSTDYIVPFSTR
jgi:hypothetical protein